MSDQANEAKAAVRPDGAGLSQGMKLYGASARNMAPRLVHTAAVMAVAAQCVGLAPTVLWGVAVWGSLIAGSKLLAALERASSDRATKVLTFAVSANNAISTVVQAAIVAAMWAQGDVLIKAFALVTAFIGAAYVLLQYYSDLDRFRLLLAPYVAAFLYMALRSGPVGALAAGLRRHLHCGGRGA